MLTKDLWDQIILFEKECMKREEKLTRLKLQDAFQIPQAEAQHIIYALSNKHIIKLSPDTFEANSKRFLVITDIHIPFQHKVNLEAVLSYAEKFTYDYIIILGDLIDFYQISRFAKNPKKKSVSAEIQETKQFLTNLRYRFPGVKIIYKEGNHEDRMQRYLMEKAKEIYDLVEDLLQNKLELHKLNIRYIKKYFRAGKLWYLHGHEKPGGAYNPEYICNVMWKYIHDHFIVGHFHRNQEKIFKNIKGDTFMGMALGYMAGEMEYALLNNWNHGFCDIQYNKNGHFRASLKKVINGEIY